jgi:23S rRNA (cytosine1962-C5)-methyltransferase
VSPTVGDLPLARVTAKGASRWVRGHPWIYRSDVLESPGDPGLCRVFDTKKKFLGIALCSPRSEIRLRLLETRDRPIDRAWWRERLARAVRQRTGIDATAFRVVHAEGDGLPSLIVDRYDRWVVAQFLSAGLETQREMVVNALLEVLSPQGILLRNDVAVRRHEGLPERVELVHGDVPQNIEVREGDIRYLAAPWTGQKTGAFLDQRGNRMLAARSCPSGGEALDCFSYHGSFALHLARRAGRVVALDSSADALERGRENARLNGMTNIEFLEGDTFDLLRSWERERRRFDIVVLDPPAFAKTKSAVPQALRGYNEINLRGFRILNPGGTLLTASCSYHVARAAFQEMLARAAEDSGRRVTLRQLLAQAPDHPEILSIPETGYLKGALLAVD